VSCMSVSVGGSPDGAVELGDDLLELLVLAEARDRTGGEQRLLLARVGRGGEADDGGLRARCVERRGDTDAVDAREAVVDERDVRAGLRAESGRAVAPRQP